MTKITIDESVVRQVLRVIDCMEQYQGNMWHVSFRAETLDIISNELNTALRAALEQPAQPGGNYCHECLTYNGHQDACSHYTTPPEVPDTFKNPGESENEWIDRITGASGQTVSQASKE